MHTDPTALEVVCRVLTYLIGVCGVAWFCLWKMRA